MSEKEQFTATASATAGNDDIELQKELKSKGGIDVAYELAQKSKGIVIDEATNKRLLRKIDRYICPLMCIVYAIQFMDKLSNSYASIMGIREDLEMTGTMYSWTGTGFYLGYLVFEFPVAYLLQRVSLTKSVGVFVVAWGFVLAMGAVPNNYPGFQTIRVLLGALESSVTPAFVVITSQWYRREEQFFRTAMWFCMNGLGSILGPAISYGLMRQEATVGTPIASWRLLFITIGVITVALGFLLYFHIPETPPQAWFLNEEEKLQVVERIRDNKQGFGNKKFDKEQAKEAFLDIRTYLIFISVLANNIPNGGVTNFGAIIVSEMGYTEENSLLMMMPTGGVQIVMVLLCGYVAQITNRRMLVGLFGEAVSLLSCCLLAFAPSAAGQLAGYWIFYVTPVAFVCMLSCVASNSAGHTKKIIVNALSLIAYCIGNLIGPLTFLESEEPSYPTAKIVMVVCCVVCIISMSGLYLVNFLANKRRDQRDERLNIENSEFADLTDKQNPEFRYAL